MHEALNQAGLGALPFKLRDMGIKIWQFDVGAQGLMKRVGLYYGSTCMMTMPVLRDLGASCPMVETQKVVLALLDGKLYSVKVSPCGTQDYAIEVPAGVVFDPAEALLHKKIRLVREDLEKAEKELDSYKRKNR